MFGRKKQKEDYILTLDIGTEFVKSVIFKVENNEKGVITGAGKCPQSLTDMQGGLVTDIQGVVDNCEEAIEQAAESARVIPSKVVMGIAGEMIKGTTTTVHYNRPNSDKKINEEELNEIVRKIEWKAFDVARRQLADEIGEKELDVKLINAAVVDVKIDGYRIVNPIGFQGKHVTMSVFNAYAPLVNLGALQTVAEELELDLMAIAAEPYAVARAFRDSGTQDFNAIFIDIGGGTTDVAVVTEGGVIGTRMFALGGRAFTKQIANYFNLKFRDAEELKIKYSRGLLDEKKFEEVRSVIRDVLKIWLSGVELALSEFEVEVLPSKILLCGGGSALPDVINLLKKNKFWRRSLPFAGDAKVDLIKPGDISSMKDDTGKMKTVQDITPMSLGDVALSIYEKESVLQGILSKVVRLIKT